MVELSKDLVAASAAPLVLGILAEGDSYGYAIMKRVAELSDGEVTWSDGMLYPLLHRLERLGHVESWKRSAPDSARMRKWYRLTHAGREALDEQRQQWAVVNRTLQAAEGRTDERRRQRAVPVDPSLGLA